MFSRYQISSTVIHGAVVSARLSKKAIHVLLKESLMGCMRFSQPVASEQNLPIRTTSPLELFFMYTPSFGTAHDVTPGICLSKSEERSVDLPLFLSPVITTCFFWLVRKDLHIQFASGLNTGFSVLFIFFQPFLSLWCYRAPPT